MGGDRSVADPEARQAHQEAWLLRTAAVDPGRAVEWLAGEDAGPELRARVLTSLAARRAGEEILARPNAGSGRSTRCGVPEVGPRLDLQ